MLLALLGACGPEPERTYGEPALLASVAADFVLEARNGVDAQHFSTYNSVPVDNTVGLWDAAYGSSVNPNQYRIVTSTSGGIVQAVRPYGTTGSVAIPSVGYVVQASGSVLSVLSGIAVGDELHVRSAGDCEPGGVPVLTYHSIGSTTTAIETHLQAIQAQGYTTITLDTLGWILDGAPEDCIHTMPPKPIVLTFDDGYADQFATLPALLDDYGMVGIFFIITSYPGTSSTRASWSSISNAVGQYPNAVELGCHSHAAHLEVGGLAKYLTLSESARLADMETCHDKLLEQTGVDVTAIAWPFGSYDAALIEVARDAGFETMWNTTLGLNVHGNNDAPGHVRRFGGNLTADFAVVEAAIDRWMVCP